MEDNFSNWQSGDRLGRKPTFPGPGLTKGPQGPNHLPKIYLLRFKWALKISRRSIQRVKSYGTVLWQQTDTQAHEHTKTNHPTTTKEFFQYMWGVEKEGNYKPYKISTSLLHDQ